MAIGYDWVNVTSRSVSRGQATVTFWIDVKLNRQDTAGNYSVVDTRLNSTIVNGLAGSGYSFGLTGSGGISGGGVWTFANETILTGQTTIYHNDDGTKTGYVSASAYNKYWNINESFGGNFDLPTIARASQPSCITSPNTTEDIGNIGDTITIYMNRKSSLFTHTVKYSFGSLTNVLINSNITDNCQWTIPNDFYNQIPNSNVGSGTIIVDTYNGGTYIGTKSIGFKCHVSNSNPQFNDFEFEEIETTILTGSSNKIIKGYSDVKIIISNGNRATGVNGATIKNYQTYIGSSNKKYDGAIEYPLNYTVENVDSDLIVTYAIDSRGNSTPVTKHAELINYEPISYSSFELERTNNVSEETTLRFSGKIDLVDFGNIVNKIKHIRYYYKKVGQSDNDYVLGNTILTPTVDINGNISIDQAIEGDVSGQGFNQNSAYVVKLEIIDELLNIYNQNFTCTETIGSGSPAQAIKDNCTALGMPYNELIGGRVQINSEAKLVDENGNVKKISDLGLDIYSTDEIIVGTWINNKPIYRKVITGSKSYVESQMTKSILKYDTVTKANGWIYSHYDQWWTIPTYHSETAYYTALYYHSTGIRIDTGAHYDNNSSTILILEYTKTTD